MWREVVTVCLVLTGVACLDKRNIVEYLSHQTEYSTLVSLVSQAGLVDTLSNIKFATVFAPTNAAFATVPTATLDSLRNNTQLLRRVLLNHVTNHSLISPQLQDNERYDNLIGGSFIFKNDGNTITVNGVKISGTDTIVANGVIHTIDGVLLPPEGDIVTYLAKHDDKFSDLFAAIVVAGLDGTLKGGVFTLFAPNDKAFNAVIGSIPTDQTKLADLLKYHVVSGSVFSNELKDGQKVSTLTGQQLTVSISNNGVKIGGATVVQADINTNSGVIHEIDGVLIPPSTS
ncbi:hypothetical protein LOTGIDRAFT_164994 [Lottia gigantea]|uniref:FAS1 domain-containing protein n=1 Tax=Lottia gigantea TaxID=225164 RepID=V3ZYE9_LOTGI|nr:hypothetical protein LOTGIDRAFT_164994 [Lottia gigantea]ESO89402.1 hypothetical protein LOTGIDRAFT_164994 [Lottia gigantea]